MNNSIKEILESYINHNEIEIILDRIKEIVDNEIIDYGEELSLSECKCLLNYITNLQKENEKLKEIINDDMTVYLKGLEDGKDKMKEIFESVYKSRNEKAIEWCKCVINSKTTVGALPNGKRTDMGYCLDLAEPLLNILQGGDE